jgi:hypothetical protein
MVITRRSRPAALASAAAVGVLGLIVAWRQRRERFFPDAAWPSNFEDLHRAGLFVVVLLLAGTLFDGDDLDDLDDGDDLDDLEREGPDGPDDQDRAIDTSEPAR